MSFLEISVFVLIVIIIGYIMNKIFPAKEQDVKVDLKLQQISTTKDLMSAVFNFLENEGLEPSQKKWSILFERNGRKMGVVFAENDPHYLSILEFIPYGKGDVELINYWANIITSNHILISYRIDDDFIMLRADSLVFTYETIILTFAILHDNLITASNILRRELELASDPSLQPQSENIAEDFEKGKSELKEKKQRSAIRYFKSVFYRLSQLLLMGNDLNDEGKELYYESAYNIGYAFVELGSLDEAYRYFEIAQLGTLNKAKYITEFANCLTSLKDARSMIFVDSQIKELTAFRKQDWTYEETELYKFLMRRKVYILTDTEQFDVAEELIKNLLTDDPENDFLWNELKYVMKSKEHNQ